MRHDLFEYGFEDNYDEKHDEYNGVYRSYLMTDVILKDGSVLKEGTESHEIHLATGRYRKWPRVNFI